ncbi:MAG TPA: acyltransferase family protein [Lactobacillaceae bacterium]|jgi:peptidoglycan/LPS O-acetylase OafA/YrhL
MLHNKGEVTHRYIRGFDGLRALAVVGVMSFHLWPTKLSGGWLGVPLFFVLSGYLITDLLIQEFDRTGAIAPWSFYKRRLWRLYPALLVMLMLTAFIIIVFVPDLIYQLRPSVLTNLGYVYNFWAIDNGASYFQQFGGQMPFTHLWSLSIEGQFYLVWPFIVWVLLKFKLPKEWVALGLFIVAVMSAIVMAILYNPTDINRVYYGTDTRVFAILVGTGLAFGYSSQLVGMKWRNWFIWSVFASTIVLLIMLDGTGWGTYSGGMFLATIILGALIAVVVPNTSTLSTFLEIPILKYLGQRSYSLYLYQLPVFVFYEKLVPNYTVSITGNLLQILLVLGLGELSYRFIEQPFRKGISFKNISSWLAKNRIRFFAVSLVLFSFIVVIGSGLLNGKSDKSAPKTALEKKLTANQSAVSKANKVAEKAQSKHSSQSSMSSSNKLTPQQQTLAREYGMTEQEFLSLSTSSLLAIGDSVLLDVAPDLQQINTTAIVDAQVGRQVQDAIYILENDARQHKIPRTILLVLGTNGAITSQQIESIMTIVGANTQVYWMNNHVPTREWQNRNNALLAEQNYKNLHVVNWQALAQQYPEWFAMDQVHQGETGNHNYLRLLAEKMAIVNKE